MAAALLGRDAQLAELGQAVERARRGTGTLLLLSGEAGVGKTRLADEAGAASGVLVLRGAASSSAVSPYGPVVAALRAYLRLRPRAFPGLGALRAHLALLLPELGEQAPTGDRATIFEAIRAALAEIGGRGPAVATKNSVELHWGGLLGWLTCRTTVTARRFPAPP